MNKFRVIFFWLFVAAYTMVSLSFSSIKRGQERCTEIEVKITDNTGNLFIESNDVIELFENEGIQLIDENINDINLDMLEEKVTEVPSILNAEVYKTVEGKLVVEVEQRNPIVRIINYNNESYYIDDEGAMMPLSDKYSAHVLIANGHINEPYDLIYTSDVLSLNNRDILGRKYIIQDIYIISKYIYQNPLWRAQIEQIYVNENEELELIPRVGMHTIIFGTAEDYVQKFRKLELLYKKGFSQHGWNQYETINLKYKNQVVCTKK